jgi:hypothetical protein
MCTSRPQPRSYMPGSTARESRNGASTMSRCMKRHVSGGNSCTGWMRCTPAQFTRMSTSGISTVSSATVSDRSTCHAVPPISAATTSAWAPSRSATTTRAPSAASRRAHASPMPLAPPVTKAVRPARPMPTSCFGR